MSNISEARRALASRILKGEGKASPSDRRAAFNNSGLEEPPAALVAKVVKDACSVTEADVASTRDSGLSEDQVFEIVVCAAIGEATRQYETALAALLVATGKE